MQQCHPFGTFGPYELGATSAMECAMPKQANKQPRWYVRCWDCKCDVEVTRSTFYRVASGFNFVQCAVCARNEAQSRESMDARP